MTDFARRFLPLYAAAMNAGRAEQYPDVFVHSADLIDAIDGALSDARGKVGHLQTERRHRDLAAMVATTAQIQDLLRRSVDMTCSLRTVLEFHRSKRSGGGND